MEGFCHLLHHAVDFVLICSRIALLMSQDLRDARAADGGSQAFASTTLLLEEEQLQRWMLAMK
jgi:hypothetical protein